ncbi:hypothetical protein BDW22DRAFT_764845 [Trametopsis cervina]|nr:hypothetical protein BDW22DRAFT_764845 [Trametopsis cervina]
MCGARRRELGFASATVSDDVAAAGCHCTGDSVLQPTLRVRCSPRSADASGASGRRSLRCTAPSREALYTTSFGSENPPPLSLPLSSHKNPKQPNSTNNSRPIISNHIGPSLHPPRGAHIIHQKGGDDDGGMRCGHRQCASSRIRPAGRPRELGTGRTGLYCIDHAYFIFYL